MSKRKPVSQEILDLREVAKKAGVKGAHLMTKKETLNSKISEATAVNPPKKESGPPKPPKHVRGTKRTAEEIAYNNYVRPIRAEADSIRGNLGRRSREYLDFVILHKDVIYDEYREVAHFIEEKSE